jgi:hypothetical protein
VISFSDPHSLFADPVPAFLTNVDPYPIPNPDSNPGFKLASLFKKKIKNNVFIKLSRIKIIYTILIVSNMRLYTGNFL